MWRAVSVHQPEGLRGLLSSAPCRVSGVEANADTPVLSLPSPGVQGPDTAHPSEPLEKCWDLGEEWGKGKGRKVTGRAAFPELPWQSHTVGLQALCAATSSWFSGPLRELRRWRKGSMFYFSQTERLREGLNQRPPKYMCKRVHTDRETLCRGNWRQYSDITVTHIKHRILTPGARFWQRLPWSILTPDTPPLLETFHSCQRSMILLWFS